MNKCRDASTHKRNWVNKLRQLGTKPEIEVIDVVSIEEWHYWEKFWIGYFKFLGCDLLNYTVGGDGCSFRNKTSFQNGSMPWNKGVRYDEETRKNISEKLKGNHCKPRISVIKCDKEGNDLEEFESITQAALMTNSNNGKISLVCLGKRKTHNNFIWKYKNNV